MLRVARVDETRQANCLHGLSRTLVSNMVVGVSEGFTKTLQMVGVGYRAAVRCGEERGGEEGGGGDVGRGGRW